MPVYQDSRYQSATPLLFTETKVDPKTGKILDINPENYLDDDRTQWSKNDFQDTELLTIPANWGETPDQVAHRVWRRSDLAWIVGEFNDDVGFDMFVVFDGTEKLTLPTAEAVFLKILPNDGIQFDF